MLAACEWLMTVMILSRSSSETLMGHPEMSSLDREAAGTHRRSLSRVRQ